MSLKNTELEYTITPGVQRYTICYDSFSVVLLLCNCPQQVVGKQGTLWLIVVNNVNDIQWLIIIYSVLNYKIIHLTAYKHQTIKNP